MTLTCLVQDGGGAWGNGVLERRQHLQGRQLWEDGRECVCGAVIQAIVIEVQVGEGLQVGPLRQPCYKLKHSLCANGVGANAKAGKMRHAWQNVEDERGEPFWPKAVPVQVERRDPVLLGQEMCCSQHELRIDAAIRQSAAASST